VIFRLISKHAFCAELSFDSPAPIQPCLRREPAAVGITGADQGWRWWTAAHRTTLLRLIAAVPEPRIRADDFA
jgi:hypothetical protein